MRNPVKLYDTLTREVKELQPGDGERFGMYVCGPTVYGPAHIGNFLTFLRFDVLYRVLIQAGYNPYYVRNITDVDDKTIKGSRTEGANLKTFTEKWTEQFHADCAKLNLLLPDVEPRATDHINEQIDIIRQLIAKDLAYVGDDGSVYFRVSNFESYGKLSHFDPKELKSQAQNSSGAVNQADEYERETVADFALWKARKEEDGENFWESPWGNGRPGWHLECSAMSIKYLGSDFDLHGGGEDLCFPHHENEIAQSEGATGKNFARHWVHLVHLLVEGKKMSKSLGNFYVLEDLIQKGWSPEEIRLGLLGGHYRQQYNFTESGLEAARSALGKIQRGADSLLQKGEMEWDTFLEMAGSPIQGDWGNFSTAWAALSHDLNTPAALGALHSALKRADKQAKTSDQAKQELNGLAGVLYVLGLRLQKPKTPETVEVPVEIVDLAHARWEAKQRKDFAEADRLRGLIDSAGYVVLDKKDGYEIHLKGDKL